jgi:4-amino-4-deoxy-L-arabinose transferase-like glycosyltransferase
MGFQKAIKRAGTSLVVIFAVALGARIAFAWNQASKMPAQAVGVVPFENEAGNIALALAEGKGFSNLFRAESGPTAWLAPVYPVILGAIFRIFGIFTARAFFVAAFFNIVCSAAACVPIYFVGKRIWGLGVAAGAAWLWAIFPNGILIPFEWIWDTSLAAFLAAALLWATLLVAEAETMLDWCAYGALWAFALLTNPALGALLPFLVAWAALQGRESRALQCRSAALAVGVTILCCVPWTIRNYVAFHRVIPLRSNLPYELWSGNNDIFDEHALGGRRMITRTEEVRHYAAVGETAFMREKWELATTFIKTHPALEVRLTGQRFLDFWLGMHAPFQNFLETNLKLVRAVLAANFLTMFGAFGGVVALWWKEKWRVTSAEWRAPEKKAQAKGCAAKKDEQKMEMGEAREKRSAVWPVAAYPVIFPLLYYVTHAQLRLRHPIDPVVMLLTAIAVAGLWDAVRKWRAAGGE